MKRHEKHHEQSIAVYPGSFDPITKGHLNVLERALSLFDHVIMLVAANPKKEDGLFTPEARLRLIREATAHLGEGKSPYRRWNHRPMDRLNAEVVWLEGYSEAFGGLSEARRVPDVSELFAPDVDPKVGEGFAEIEPHTDLVTVAWLKTVATVDFCEAVGARAMIRGLRSVTDFDQEFELAIANMELAEQIETIFMVPRPENHFVSSSKVREIVELRGAEAIARYVPEPVYEALRIWCARP